ncbi:MAG TPA: prepilin peptidase [archaeon]|nr:prepilin peptidase [archaeon]
MYEYLPLTIAVAGSSIAGLWDLKTTEIPDLIPRTMTIIALIFWGVYSYLLHDYSFIINSVLVGGSLFAFGFLMYYAGQWGGGDAKLLSSTGFLIPSGLGLSKLLFPFALSYLVNVFLIGAVYMIGYAAVMALRDKKIVKDFSYSVKSSSKIMFGIPVLIFLSFMAFNLFLSRNLGVIQSITFHIYNSLFISILSLGLMFTWKFALSVEKIGFKKKIPVSKVREGDVLESFKYWEGATKEQVARIKKSGKRFVVVKDGVRFGPVFPIALLFTIYVGDFIALFFNTI